MTPHELVQQGRPHEALPALKEEIRNDSANPKPRLFYFQLLAVLGDWERASQQLQTLASLDIAHLPLAHEYTALMQGEAFRAEVFAGARTPLLFGEPAPWIGILLQSLKLLSGGKTEQAVKLQAEALASAPAQGGSIDGQPLAWLCDADSRLGPVIEAYIDGKYYWIPCSNIASIKIEKPTDLRDLIWLSAKFTWTTGVTALGYIPARYPGSESSEDGHVCLSRTTVWRELGANYNIGTGVRILTTDQNDYPITMTREILLTRLT